MPPDGRASRSESMISKVALADMEHPFDGNEVAAAGRAAAMPGLVERGVHTTGDMLSTAGDSRAATARGKLAIRRGGCVRRRRARRQPEQPRGNAGSRPRR